MPQLPHRWYLLLPVLVAGAISFAPPAWAESTTEFASQASSSPHPFGILSLVPPLVAVTLAVATRRIVMSLLAAIVVGSLITTRGNILESLANIFEIHLWATLVEEEMLRLFAFTSAIGATVGIIYANGGMRGLVGLIEPLARGPRSGQFTAWLAGMIVFFDDYSNTLLLGNTFRPTFDRLRISREKLAYVVDSTSAPIAAMALISTWIAVELDYLEQGINAVAQIDPEAAVGFSQLNLFVNCIPYRFYAILALFFVLLVAVTGRDYGPMLAAERRRLREQASYHPGVDSAFDVRERSHWINAVLPLGTMLSVVVWLIVHSGLASLQAEAAETGLPLPTWNSGLLGAVFGASDPMIALQYGGLAGLGVAVAMTRWWKLLPSRQMWQGATRGAMMMIPALLVLWLATGLSEMTRNVSVTGEDSVAYEYQNYRLYTGNYMVEQLEAFASQGNRAEWMVAALPTIIFVVAAAISFATGSSYGTMGLMVPMTIPLAYATLRAAGVPFTPDHPCILGATGSVLAGSIFGDHCSPLADTTILSSQASGCDHLSHVYTQLPYALTIAGVCVLGTIGVGLQWPVAAILPLQGGLLLLVIYLFGRRAGDEGVTEGESLRDFEDPKRDLGA
jgi:Na+/H+ antiporter NhaC